MEIKLIRLCICLMITSFSTVSATMAETPSPAIGPNFSVNAGKCELLTDEIGGITKYVGDCHLERQNESSGAISSNNPSRRLYCFNDYKLTASSEGAVIGGPTADSWIGCSICAGERCESFLIPGFPNDASELGVNSEVRKAGFNAAADPVVISLPDGAFSVAFLGFYRGTTTGGKNAPDAGIFQQLIVDMENNEKDLVDSLALLPQITVDLTNEQLVDKPDAAFIVATGPQQMCSIGTVMAVPPTENDPAVFVDKSIPCGKVLTSFTTFNGETGKNARSKINLCTHDLSPKSRDRCVRADEQQHVDSGVALAPDPDPVNPGRLYLFWRRFPTPNEAQTNAIVQAISTDAGATFGSPQVIFSSVPFGDFPRLPQPELPQLADFVLARSTAFLTTSVAHLSGKSGGEYNPVYLCWSEVDATSGEGQIVCSYSSDGGATWPEGNKKVIDPSSGNQFQPAIDCAAGQCSLAWYDARFDMAQEFNLPLGGRTLPADWPLEYDNEVILRPHHTVDVRMAQWEPAYTNSAPSPPCYSGSEETCVFSFQVSKYPLTVANFAAEGDPPSYVLVPLQTNPLNPLTNCKGTCAFFGDYMDTFYPKWLRYTPPGGSAQWIPNIDIGIVDIAKILSRDVWLSWTGNNQIRFPNDNDWTTFNKPILPEDGSDCVGNGVNLDRYGLHNQEVFTTRISPSGFNVVCPRCTKPLVEGVQRTFLLILENVSDTFITLQAIIAPTPEGVTASFNQFPLEPPKDTWVTQTEASISPFGKKTRTVFVTCESNTNCDQPITVQVSKIVDGEATEITAVFLNGNFAFPESGEAQVEIHDLALFNTTVQDTPLVTIDPANLALFNLALFNNPENLALFNLALFNGGATNLALFNAGAANLALFNYDLDNLALFNLNLDNLALFNTAANLALFNSSLNDSEIDSSVSTKTWTVSAENTTVTSGYDVAFLSENGQVPEGFEAFAIITRNRPAYSLNQCGELTLTPTLAGQEILGILPVSSDTVMTPGDLALFNSTDGYQNLSLFNGALDDSTYPMDPGDEIQVTLVVQNKTNSGTNAAILSSEEGSLTPEDVLSQFSLFSTAQAISSTGVLSHTPVPQTITLTIHAPATAVFNTSFTVAASATSGLPVVFSSGSPTVCTNSGATFTMVSGTGTCVVQYNQPGNGSYYPAAQLSEPTTAQKAVATVTLSDLIQTYTGSPLSPTATTNPASLAIVWTGAPQTIVGEYPVTATINDANYQGSASGTFVINKAAATVTLSNLTQTYTGGPLSPTATTTPPGLAIVWSGAPQTNAGSYAVTATVNDSNYLGSASGTFVINKAAATVTLSNLTQTYTGSPLSPGATTAPPDLAIVWTGAPQTNAGSYAVTATINDTNYQGSANGIFVINMASQTITFSSLTDKSVGDPDFTVSASASSGLPVTFTASDNCTVSGNTVHLTDAGSCTITAKQSGNSNYLAAPDVSRAFNIKYRFDGFYPKLGPADADADGTSKKYGPFNVGSTVTLKWALYDASNQFYAGDIDPVTGKSRITIALLDENGGPIKNLVAPGDTPGATIFRIDWSNPQYLFNWDTTLFSGGTYILVLTDAGGVHSVTVRLR